MRAPTFSMAESLPILERTPAVLRALLAGLPEPWIVTNEGGDSWSPFDVLGHLIHGERTDWLQRAEMILGQGESATFPPFDRFAQFQASRGRSLDELLDTFAELRAANVRRVRQLDPGPTELARRGRHPEFGPVTLGQHLSTWVAHDLSHLAQIARVMARRYTSAVGPWRAYLPILGAELEVRIAAPPWVDPKVDWDRVYGSDEERMRLAVGLARENVERGSGGPFGAAVFEAESGRVVAVGVNSVTRLESSALHAEVVALMLAQRRVGSFTLAGPGLPQHELVTSCEPCAMCLGAILWSGARRLVCGATREDALALRFDEGPVFPESYAWLESRGIEVTREVLREEAAAVLELYARRGGPIYNG